MGFYITNWGQGRSSKRGRQRERESTDGGQFVLSALFTISHCLQPALRNVHTDGRVFVCTCVYVHARAHMPAKPLNTLYIFILEDESGASN